MTFLIKAYNISLKNKTVLQDVDVEFSKNLSFKKHCFLPVSVPVKKQVIFTQSL